MKYANTAFIKTECAHFFVIFFLSLNSS